MIIHFRLKLDRFYCTGVMNEQKKNFLVTWQTNIQKRVTIGLIDKSYKKRKKDILKKKQQSIMHTTKKQ